MKQKLLTLLLTLSLTVTSVFPGVALAASGDEISASAAIEETAAPKTMSASEKISALERTLYGTEQAGALVAKNWLRWKEHYMALNRQVRWLPERTALKTTFTAPLPLTRF